jgi:hypothetical protein
MKEEETVGATTAQPAFQDSQSSPARRMRFGDERELVGGGDGNDDDELGDEDIELRRKVPRQRPAKVSTSSAASTRGSSRGSRGSKGQIGRKRAAAAQSESEDEADDGNDEEEDYEDLEIDPRDEEALRDLKLI